MYTLIPTVYRALLKSAVSGIGHRIHTTKKTDLTTHAGRLCNALFGVKTGLRKVDQNKSDNLQPQSLHGGLCCNNGREKSVLHRVVLQSRVG